MRLYIFLLITLALLAPVAVFAQSGAESAAAAATNTGTVEELAEADVLLERPAPDQGYYFGVAVEGMFAKIIDDGDTVPTLGGWSLALRTGQSINEWLDLGVGFQAGPFSGQDNRAGYLVAFGLECGLRPYDAWLIRAGLGVGGYDVDPPTNSTNGASAYGMATSLAVGYTFHPFASKGDSGGWELVPLLQVRAIEPVEDDTLYSVGIALEVTWWGGLPKHQLELTLDEAFAPRD